MKEISLYLRPSHHYQNQAIMDLLIHNGWFEFSILASDDDYGVYSVVYFQYLAAKDNSFMIKDVQHFKVGVS